MSNALLIINEEAHARELSRVAELLLKGGGPRPIYFVEERMKRFGVHTGLAQTTVQTLTADDFGVIRSVKALPTQNRRLYLLSALVTLLSRMAQLSRRLEPIGRWLRATGASLIAGERDRILQRYALCDEVLSRQSFTTIVLCEDNIEFDTATWILAARQRGIRSIIVPYTIANAVELTEAYVFNEALQLEASLANRAFARWFPKWCAHHKGRSFLRCNVVRIAAIEILGLAPPNPFLLNSGTADAIAVESPAMFDYYAEAGIPSEQLVVTGTLVDDLMFEVKADASGRRRALLEENKLPLDQPILLCAFPPDQGVFDRPGCEFRDFDDMIEYWGRRLGAVKDWNVIVARHPKTPPDRLDALRQFGLALTHRDTASIVPLCDLYVASVSATIRWAIACGKPVINYDAYRLDFQDYAGMEAVLWSNAREDFERTLTEATSDAAHLARLQAAQRREAPRWGFPDGRSGRRMQALLTGNAFEQPDPGFNRG
jgi:hypothetical protein